MKAITMMMMMMLSFSKIVI